MENKDVVEIEEKIREAFNTSYKSKEKKVGLVIKDFKQITDLDYKIQDGFLYKIIIGKVTAVICTESVRSFIKSFREIGGKDEFIMNKIWIADDDEEVVWYPITMVSFKII